MGAMPDMRSDIAAAIDETQFSTDDTEAEAAADAAEAAELSVPATDDGTEPGKAEDLEPPATAEAETPAEDLPDEFWGTDLEGIPAEQRQSILDKLQSQEGYIHQLQAKLAAQPAPEPQAPVAPEEVTDEALLQVLGFDPEDYETQTLAPKILPLARTVLDLEEKVDAITNAATQQSVATAWNGAIDELEGTYGKLPGTREQVLKEAIDRGVASPYELYFQLHAPAKREVDSLVRDARRAAAKVAEAGGVKPSSSTGAPVSAVEKGMSLNDAVKAAMAETEKEKGVKLRSLFGKKTSGSGPVFE